MWTQRNLFVFVILTSLTACSLTDADDYATRLRPTISVSQKYAAVGELVEVAVEGGFRLLNTSNVPSVIMYEVALGTCFSIQASEELYGFCAPDIDNSVLPPHLQVSEGSSYTLEAGDLVIKRGQNVTIRHTFAFTATKAETVKLFGDMQFLEEGYDALSDTSGSPTTITFR